MLMRSKFILGRNRSDPVWLVMSIVSKLFNYGHKVDVGWLLGKADILTAGDGVGGLLLFVVWLF